MISKAIQPQLHEFSSFLALYYYSITIVIPRYYYSIAMKMKAKLLDWHSHRNLLYHIKISFKFWEGGLG